MEEENAFKEAAEQKEKRVRNALGRIDAEFVRAGSRRVTDEDVQQVVEKADAIEERLSKDGPLGRFMEDGRLLLALVKEYWDGAYRQVPYWTLAAVAFALLYVANPLDLIPDALPGIGLVDDAAVLSVCLLMVEQDLHDYKAWRAQRQNRAEADEGAS